MNNLQHSYVNNNNSYFSYKNYNNIVKGLVTGPKESSQTPNMNPQIVLNFNTPYNPYNSLTYDSSFGNYYTISSGQYGSKICEVNVPRVCQGVKKPVRSPIPYVRKNSNRIQERFSEYAGAPDPHETVITAAIMAKAGSDEGEFSSTNDLSLGGDLPNVIGRCQGTDQNNCGEKELESECTGECKWKLFQTESDSPSMEDGLQAMRQRLSARDVAVLTSFIDN